MAGSFRKSPLRCSGPPAGSNRKRTEYDPDVSPGLPLLTVTPPNAGSPGEGPATPNRDPMEPRTPSTAESDRLMNMTPGMRAAINVASRLGLHADDPVLIQETNNTVVWLRPHPVIAKVGYQCRQCRHVDPGTRSCIRTHGRRSAGGSALG